VAVPAVAIAGILVGPHRRGALASSISVSGQEFTITSDQLVGTGFAQFGGSLAEQQNGQTPVIVSTMKNATLSHLCQSVTVLGLTIRLTAGRRRQPGERQPTWSSTPTTRRRARRFSATSASARTRATLGGPAGTFGEDAEQVTINNLVQHTWYTTAGTFTLPGLSLGFGGSC